MDDQTPNQSRRRFIGTAAALVAAVTMWRPRFPRPLRQAEARPAALQGSPTEQTAAAADAARATPPPPHEVLSDVFAKPQTVRAPRAVEVIAREGWGAKTPKPWLQPHQIQRLTVHHSATVLKNNKDAPSHFRLYQRIHRRKRPDIAYHLLIDRKGNIYEGRPILASGESTSYRHGYDATGHLLVMCDGNFVVQKVSKRQMNALADVLAWASIRFGVSASTITGHRDHAPTACPGTNLYRTIRNGSLRKMVERRVATGGVDLVLVPGKRAKRRVALIEAGR